jgi:peptide/nickel transport system permease protein
MSHARRAAAQVGGAVLAIWGAVTVVFLVTRLLGDPATLLLPLGAGEEQAAALRTALGLDRPLLMQYLHYLGSAFTGDFGVSFQQQRPAMQLVLERLPATAALAGSALCAGVLAGAIAGTIAALRRGPWTQRVLMPLVSVGQAMPAFWLGIMLIMVFSVRLGWLPTGGRGGWAHVFLPALTLAAAIAASVARLLRASLIEVLGEDHVRTAYAKGLLPSTILLWHVLRNGLVPVVTMIGILAGELLGGSIVIETVFAWPGIGRLLVQSIAGRDFPVIQAAVLVIATLYVLINLLVDLLYGVLDPRMRATRSAR